MRINGERTGDRLEEQHLPHGAHDKEDEQPGDDIRQQDRRPGPFQGAGGAHKQAHANRPAKGDEFDMTSFQPTLKLRFFL